MRCSLLLGVAPGLVLAAALTSAREAHAGPYVGVDLDLGTAFQDHVDFSYGLGGRLGYKFHLGPPVWILPEIGGHYMSFGSSTDFAHAGAVFGGLRIGFDGFVQPNVFAHLGAGFVGDGDLGPYTDVGVGLDFQILRVFSMGVQVAYNTVLDNGSQYGATKWLSFGLNFGIDFTRQERRR